MKHFLGYGPEAPRLARAVRARARARAKYRKKTYKRIDEENYDFIDDFQRHMLRN